MDPLTMGLLMGGAGLAKGELIDKPREQRQRKMEAEIQRWSPWTGMGAKPVQQADPFASAMQGGMSGAMLGGALQNSAGPAAAAETNSMAAASDQVPMASAQNAPVPAPAANGLHGSSLVQPQTVNSGFSPTPAGGMAAPAGYQPYRYDGGYSKLWAT